jgi:peptidoglycan/LPS O-acetylase OafA/YrhL
VLWVVAYHLQHFELFPRLSGALGEAFELGHAGVDLFFVLSGYLIGGIVLAELEATGTLSARGFWWRRWLRTLPAYYATLAFIAITVALWPGTHGWSSPASYLVFLQNYASDLSHFGWSWSLCVEEHFYLALPIVVLVGRKLIATPRALLRTIAVLALLEAVVARLVVAQRMPLENLPEQSYFLELYALTHTRLDGLAVGLFLTTLPRDERRALPAFALSLALILVAGLLEGSASFRTWSHLLFATAFGAATWTFTRDPKARDLAIPGARFVADISYALYLLHEQAIRAVVVAAPTWPAAAKVAAALSLSFGGAIALRFCVEKPFLWLRERYGAHAQSRPS